MIVLNDNNEVSTDDADNDDDDDDYDDDDDDDEWSEWSQSEARVQCCVQGEEEHRADD